MTWSLFEDEALRTRLQNRVSLHEIAGYHRRPVREIIERAFELMEDELARRPSLKRDDLIRRYHLAAVMDIRREGQEWLPLELEQLSNELESGLDLDEIALLHQRSIWSITEQTRLLRPIIEHIQATPPNSSQDSNASSETLELAEEIQRALEHKLPLPARLQLVRLESQQPQDLPSILHRVKDLVSHLD